MVQIKLLSDKTINQIAAGEVIERPVSVVKELVENAIDAGSTSIIIEMENGGKNLISVSDNGSGIVKEQLLLAIQRHATSKLDESDIHNITSFGFRGEALPSIAAVSKTSIISRTPDSENAWQLNVEGGNVHKVKPSARDLGTTVEVRDLFCYTPTRLKFLKSDTSEKIAAIDLVNRFALANPNVALKLIFNNKTIITTLNSDQKNERIQEIMGDEFIKNSIEFRSEKDGIKIFGFAGLPTFNSSNSNDLYSFVNSRNVKDKLIINALRVAYINLIPNGRYPSVVLFIEIEPYAVDVNVHPTKSEIRFRDSNAVKNFISETIRTALRKTISSSVANVSHDPSKNYKTNEFSSKPYATQNQISNSGFHSPLKKFISPETHTKIYALNAPQNFASTPNVDLAEYEHKFEEDPKAQNEFKETLRHPMGYAVSQIANTYIIAQNENGIVIVDQHALHERLTLEKIKSQFENGNVKTQLLLVPEVIELTVSKIEILVEHQTKLKKLGINITRNGNNQIVVREIPDVFNGSNIKELITDFSEMLEFDDSDQIINAKQEEILGEFACKNSIRAGRKLNLIEMNALLRELENTPLAGQCNHGRPTFVELPLSKLNKMFERT